MEAKQNRPSYYQSERKACHTSAASPSIHNSRFLSLKLLSQNLLRISSINVVRIRVHGLLPIGPDRPNNSYDYDFITPALLSVVDACKLRMSKLILYRSSTRCQGSFTYSRSDIACKELGIFQLVFATLMAGNNRIEKGVKVSIGGLRMLI